MITLNNYDTQFTSIEEDAKEKKFIGRAYLPFSLFTRGVIIYDEKNQPIY